MLQLPTLTWIRFGIWLLLGLVIYFFYGMRNSRLAKRRAERERERALSEGWSEVGSRQVPPARSCAGHRVRPALSIASAGLERPGSSAEPGQQRFAGAARRLTSRPPVIATPTGGCELHHRQQADGQLGELPRGVVGDALRQRVAVRRPPPARGAPARPPRPATRPRPSGPARRSLSLRVAASTRRSARSAGSGRRRPGSPRRAPRGRWRSRCPRRPSASRSRRSGAACPARSRPTATLPVPALTTMPGPSSNAAASAISMSVVTTHRRTPGSRRGAPCAARRARARRPAPAAPTRARRHSAVPRRRARCRTTSAITPREASARPGRTAAPAPVRPGEDLSRRRTRPRRSCCRRHRRR